MAPFLIWMGAALDPSGYGEATRNYLFGLDALRDGQRMRLINRRFWQGRSVTLPPQRLARLKELTEMPPPSADDDIILLMNLTPENYLIADKVKHHVCMTTFETDGIPEHWKMPIRAMDLVLTYSQFNVDTFRDAGITNVPILTVPHGVDTEMFRPRQAGDEVISSVDEAVRGKFVFGSNFEWSNRKNPKGLLEAYYRTFSADDGVVLLLKTYHQFPLSESASTIKREIAALQAMLKVGPKRPPVMLVTDMVPSDEMPKLYTTMDCFVLPSRGEGWGLPYSEAMSCGLPTIGTNWSGNTEFMNQGNSYLVDSKLVMVPNKDVTQQPHYRHQRWAEPSVEHLGHLMRHVYEHRDESAAKGRRARQDMCEKWTWQLACQKLNHILSAL